MDATNRAEPKLGPVRFRLGRTVVKIYPKPATDSRKAGFQLADYSTGKRRFRWFPDLKEAKQEAARIASLINAGDQEGASMTGEERRQLVRSSTLIEPYHLDVATACELFAQAAKLVGPHQVVAAAEQFAKQHPATREKRPLKESAEAYQEAKEQRKRSPRTLKSLAFYLGRFVEAHPEKDLSDFTGPDIQRWLDDLKRDDGKPLSAISRRHYRIIIGGFFGYCHRRGFIIENPAVTLEKESAETQEDVEFWNPEETRRLLAQVPKIARDALVVQLFCGLRASEACEILWRDVDLEAGHIQVAREKAKTRSRRLAPITPNAKKWLSAKGQPDSKVYPEHPDTFSDRVTEGCKLAGIRRLKNGARHSCITYSVALTGDVSRVALDCGTSASMVFNHYRGLATKEAAQEFFRIEPPGSTNPN